MPVLTFRLKLVLAMMVVVAGVCFATLMVTQRQVKATYEENLRRQFDRQISYFIALQDARLGGVKEQCLKLARSERLLEALSQTPVRAEVLYDTTVTELRALLGSMFQEARMAGAIGAGRGAVTFMTFLDANGRVIPVPDTVKKQPGLAIQRWRLEQRVSRIRGALESPEIQQIGYLDLSQEVFRPARTNFARAGAKARTAAQPVQPVSGNSNELQEVILTRMVDTNGQRALGTLLMGFPLPDLVPTARTAERGDRTERLQSGILMEDRLYANPSVIPEDIGATVARTIGQRIPCSSASGRDDFDCTIGPTHYRVFYKLLNPQSAFPPAYQVCLYSTEEALQAQRELRWKILTSGGGAMAGAFLLSLLLSQGLSVPIRELVAGTGKIRQGNFDVKVPVRSSDELGQLASSFNEMAEGLAQKERYRTVLNLVADEQVARQLVGGEITLGGEVREVSMLFCDIRGFTAFTEHMPPGEVIEMLNEHMTALTHVVKAHNGVLDKFVGDLLMAVFGAPVSHDNDALDAARCALRLIEERERLNQSSRYKRRVGIGVATGNVVAGCMGSTDRLNYTVLGERVNLASRLCDQAAEGEILVDETTVERLKSMITIQPGPAMRLKGFAEPVQAYRLLSVKSPEPTTEISNGSAVSVQDGRISL